MKTRPLKVSERAIAAVLDHHFGDGLVYLTHAEERSLLECAISLGLVSPEGYLTRAGYRLWRRVDQAGAV